jgi:hypothetical protein
VNLKNNLEFFWDCFFYETLPNFIERKHPSKGEKKKQGGMDQSPSKQTTQKR